MLHKSFELEDRRCLAWGDAQPRFLLIQPCDESDAKGLESETAFLRERTQTPFLLLAFQVKNWNTELSPWPAGPVLGRDGFGGGARGTLAFVLERLIPYAAEAFGIPADCPLVLGGYSLAGLFALWSAYQTDVFSAIAAASPSVWFPGFMDEARMRPFLAKAVYLSLGDREEKTRNPVMAAVGDCIRSLYAQLKKHGLPAVLEWNEGNHFREPDIRTAKAFAWCIGQMAAENAP